jgi:hypothetical protein
MLPVASQAATEPRRHYPPNQPADGQAGEDVGEEGGHARSIRTITYESGATSDETQWLSSPRDNDHVFIFSCCLSKTT